MVSAATSTVNNQGGALDPYAAEARGLKSLHTRSLFNPPRLVGIKGQLK